MAAKPLVFYGELAVMQSAGPTEVQFSSMFAKLWNVLEIHLSR